MSGKEPRHSQPNWATLTDAGSVATSEDDILESSQDMRDELMDTSPEGSRAGSQQPRKRTASNSASASFGGNTHKRRKTSGGSVPVGFGSVDGDDRPASAHAKPTRIPSVQPRRTSLSHSAASASSLAAGLSEFERRRGGLPVPSSSKPSTSSGNKPPDFTQRFKDISVNVARKKTGKGKGKGKGPAPRQSTLAFEIIPSPTKNKSPQKNSQGSSWDALSSSDEDLPSTPRELLAACMKSQSTSSLLDKGKKPLIAERRKTISNDDILDLTLDSSSDKEARVPSPRKSASASSFRRAVGPIRPKNFELRGNVDDPIVLSSDDEEIPVAAPPRASSHMAHTSPKPMPVTEPEQDDAPMSWSPEPLPPKPMERRSITPPPPVYSPPKQAPAAASPAVSTNQESASAPIASTSNAEPMASGSRLPALASPSPTTSTATVPVPIPRTSRKGRSVMRGHFFKGVFDRQQSSAAKSATSPPLPSSSQPRKPTVHERQTQSPQSPQSSSEHASNVLVSSAQASVPSSVPVSAVPSAAASSAASSQSALVSPVVPAETDEVPQQGAPINADASISAKTPSPEPPMPQSPIKPSSSKSPNKGFTTELSKKIAEVQVNHAMQMGLFIDLTQSDTEGSERMDLSDREASPEAIESARRLAEVAPELMDFDIPQHIGPLAPRDPSPPKATVQATAPSEPAAAGPSSNIVAPSPLDFIRKLTAGKRPAAPAPPTSASVPASPAKPLHPKPRIPAIIRPESREREEEEVNMLLEGVQEGEDSEYTNEEQNDADEDEVEEAPSSDDIRSRLRSRVRQADLLPSPTWSSDSDSSDRPLAQRPRTRGGPTDTLVPRLSVMALDNSSDSDEFTWEKDGKRWAKEHASIYMRARDLDFNLQDRMTALSIDARRGDDMQRVAFESIISVGTAEDEPFAPNIEIRNSIDDELSPPFEFHYTNKMWHSDNVPPPDVENLQGCDCIGRCDPNSKTCACVQRQAPYMPLGQKGFAYDKFGRIRKQVHGQMPIFECNALCKCDDDLCQNRVVQRGRTVHINIEKTAEKGWGVFAGEKIKAHTFLGIYAGEFLTNSEGDARGTIYDAFGRTYLFDIDFYWMKKDWKPETQQTGDEVPKSQGSKDQDSDDDDDDGVKYCVDAYHAGNFTRYLNHSCDPNCNIVPVFINEANMDKPLLTIFTLREVAAGEELCFSYFGEMDDDEKPEDDERALDAAVHAPCRCGAARCRGRMWK